MPSPLPRVWDLIKDSWNAFVKTWDVTVRISIGFILVGVLQAIGGVNSRKLVLGDALAVVCLIAAGLVAICTTIALYRAVLKLEQGDHSVKTAPGDIWNDIRLLILPLLLVGLLQGLATFGATLLLIIPGIYVGVRLGFSQLALLDKNLRGRAALAESWALTKDRFWAVFGRQIAAAMLFGLGVGTISAIAMSIVIAMAGPGFAAMVSDETSRNGNAIVLIVSSLIQAAFVPLMMIYEVKMFRALLRTR
jgi:hypothetical protein